MKDIQRSKVNPFNRHCSGYVAEQLLISLDRVFAIHDFNNNVKVRFSITNLELFGATWWNIKEKKLGINMKKSHGSYSWKTSVSDSYKRNGSNIEQMSSTT